MKIWIQSVYRSSKSNMIVQKFQRWGPMGVEFYPYIVKKISYTYTRWGRVTTVFEKRDGWVDHMFLECQEAFITLPQRRLIRILNFQEGNRGECFWYWVPFFTLQDQFQCNTGLCILETWLCDKDMDCRDGEDEENCPQTMLCADQDDFRCRRSGGCISSSRLCDGQKDCADG